MARHPLIIKSEKILEVHRGFPMPFGPTVRRTGVNFSIFSRHATSVELLLFRPREEKPFAEIALNPNYNRTGDVWHVFVPDLDPGFEYAYRMDRHPNKYPALHRYQHENLLLDPYARAIVPISVPGKTQRSWRSVIVDDTFDWGTDHPLNIHLADYIIYEMHIRAFTFHPSSKMDYPGTYRGVIEKIPYLKKLGVNAVELLPITEFDELDNPRKNPITGEQLKNFWGYHPISFFAPKLSYASDPTVQGAIREFKTMVKSLHEAGIEVILDMVFNHTAEGNEDGPTLSFRGIDNSIYYQLNVDGTYRNYSGCGNTLNCNHPVVRDLILDCLCYWVTEMHVDGFRFDLASILGRGVDGSVLSNPPLIERIASTPVLANVKLIAEAWDAGGLYQVGSFPSWGRWAEWNGKFRDDVRRFVKGDEGMVPVIATRISGSSDLYQTSGREPFHSINFITSHDGFTLNDLVSYDQKHNLMNGEEDRDGSGENFSWNCGHEGNSSDPEIVTMRQRQMKNFAALLLFSQGVPMILSGDEVARTQNGNNNAYCQDNEISWFDWNLNHKNAELFRFFQQLIHFRQKHPILRRRSFDEKDRHSPWVSWHGKKLGHPDWSPESRSLALHLHGKTVKDCDLYFICHSHWQEARFQLPKLHRAKKWFRVMDTSLESPWDFADDGQEPIVNRAFYSVPARSCVLLIAK